MPAWRSVTLDPDQLGQGEDWAGNNAAFTYPECGNVFLVSQMLHRNGRDCPSCGRSHAEVTGGSKSGGTAWIESQCAVVPLSTAGRNSGV